MIIPALKMRAPIRMVCVVTLAASALFAHGLPPAADQISSASAGHGNNRAFNVTALDEKGQPVKDLASADFQIFEDGKPQAIATFNPLFAASSGKNPPTTTLILFDLLNVFAGQRENSATLIVRALQPLDGRNMIYLYLLTNHGDLYNVASTTQQTAAPSQGSTDHKPPDSPWTQQARPLLDQAIAKVNALRIKDYQDEGVSAAATFLALNQLGDAFTKIPGPKTIVWITRGAPNWLDYRYGCKDVVFSEGSESYVGGRCGNDCTRRPGMSKCVDYTPFLQHFGGELARSDTIFYSVMVDPEGSIYGTDRGRPRDTLQQLADLSGGRMYARGEIDQAIAQSLQDVRARYQLTYDAPAPDGKYHKLRVECSRKGVIIEAPRGYYAEQPRQK
jgi:VWFA-related protein